MADAKHPDPPDAARAAEPSAPVPPRPLARGRFSPPGADDAAVGVEDDTHEGSVALLAAWG